MSDHDHTLDSLLQRLEALMRQQQTFMQDIEALRAEINALKGEKVSDAKPVDARSAEVPKVQEEPTPEAFPDQWPDLINLAQLRKSVKEFTTGTTKGGVEFIRFSLQKDGQHFVALCAANGNWILQDHAENLVAKGRMNEAGTHLLVTNGLRQGDKISAANILDGLVQSIAIKATPAAETKVPAQAQAKPAAVKAAPVKRKEGPGTLEKFIGENLIAVIAVVILLIGVVFGVKYSIDHNLISPMTRVLLSYLLGAAILGVGMKLKAKYALFSAILVSGSMAILYVTTFIGYALYALFPQAAAFALMLLFTVFTVFTAIHYNRQIIAHIALVGSYAIPFLLSNGSGKVEILYSYMLLVNTGILVIAFMRHWKPLYYVAFGFTWLIYGSWVLMSYDPERHLFFALLFGSLFFLQFYATFLVYKLVRNEQFASEDVAMFVLNSILFYGPGYYVLSDSESGQHYLGLFTLCVAVVHFIVSVIMYTRRLANRALFHLTSAMVLCFLTMAVPVQLDGNWVTLLWSFEAAALFIVGRTQAVRLYENLSYVVQSLAIASLLIDWLSLYGYRWRNVPEWDVFLNSNLLHSLLSIAALGAALYVGSLEKHRVKIAEAWKPLAKTMETLFSLAFIALLYNVFRLEIMLYFDQAIVATKVENKVIEFGLPFYNATYDTSLSHLQVIWVLNYSLAFTAVLTFFDQWKTLQQWTGTLIQILSMLALLVFITFGFYEFGRLTHMYLHQDAETAYPLSSSILYLRYFSVALVALSLFALMRYRRADQTVQSMKVVLELFMHLIILTVVCSELVNILYIQGSHAQNKLGLSILCGLYSFFLIGLGIFKRKQYLRIAAFVLFGLVLLKLFFYDIAHLSTIAKTIVFIVLGLILLVISFLYNKYKDQIIPPNEENPAA
jgi:uncharacterized membrane protein